MERQAKTLAPIFRTEIVLEALAGPAHNVPKLSAPNEVNTDRDLGTWTSPRNLI